MADPITFTLVDADGQPHEYSCRPHPAREGSDIMWRLVALGAEPLGRAAKGLLHTLDAGNLRQLMDDPNGLEKIAAAVDFAALGADVRAALQATPMSELVHAVLKYTSRDGKGLSNPILFDAAYTRNYGELLRAAWEAVQANRFLSLPATSSTGPR